GLLILMLTAWVPQLHPTPCSIQQQQPDSVSWTLGYGLFALFMVVAIIVFFAGIRVYSYVQPEGSILYSIAQVLVAARHKKHLHLPASEDTEGAFYDPTFQNDSEGKLPLTKEFR
ncbi:nitrate transporter 1.7-like, partial [Trifolium medium]|nr:nitrate transporter 1.7-like [Trifolium medium]